MMKEECTRCEAYTGNAGIGEDSLFVNGIGPLCEHCYGYHALLADVEKVRDEYRDATKHASKPLTAATFEQVDETLTRILDKHKEVNIQCPKCKSFNIRMLGQFIVNPPIPFYECQDCKNKWEGDNDAGSDTEPG